MKEVIWMTEMFAEPLNGRFKWRFYTLDNYAVDFMLWMIYNNKTNNKHFPHFTFAFLRMKSHLVRNCFNYQKSSYQRQGRHLE